MTLEVEQKFHVSDHAELRERLSALGARFSATIEQSDTYYAHPARDFAVTDEALRIRSIGDENAITYKGPKAAHAIKTRREIELPLAAGKQAASDYGELLAALGFRPVATVRKRREPGELTWRDHLVNVALDTVDALGTFCEIEVCVDESEAAVAQKLVATLAAELDLTNVERRSYLGMQLGSEPK